MPGEKNYWMESGPYRKVGGGNGPYPNSRISKGEMSVIVECVKRIYGADYGEEFSTRRAE